MRKNASILSSLLLLLLTSNLYAQSAYWVSNQQAPSLEQYSVQGQLLQQVPLLSPAFGIAVDTDGSAWACLSDTQQVVHIGATGELLLTIETQSSLRSIAIAANGDLWISQPTENQVANYAADGSLLHTYNVGTLPNGLAIDAQQNVWVSNSFGSANFGASVSRINPTTQLVDEFEVPFYPTGLASHPDGNLWVASKNGVVVLDPSGQQIAQVQAGIYPRGIAVSGNGDVWVSHYISNTVVRFNSAAQILGTFAVGSHPWGVSALGNGDVIVASRTSSELHRLSSTGTVLQVTPINEVSCFGDMTGLTQALVVRPKVDSDSDGYDNEMELNLGYDPLNEASMPVQFTRGDTDRNGNLGVSDLISHLRHIMLSEAVSCVEALDYDDDGQINLIDSLSIASFLFQGGQPPAAPFPDADYDPNPAAALGCNP